MAQVKDAQLRVGARAEELTAKTDNLTLGVKDVLDRVAEVGADTMTIRLRGTVPLAKLSESDVMFFGIRLVTLACESGVLGACWARGGHAPEGIDGARVLGEVTGLRVAG